VAARLGELGFGGKVLELRMPEGAKDPADLHVAEPTRFEARLVNAVQSAPRISLPASAARGRPDVAKPARATQAQGVTPPTFKRALSFDELAQLHDPVLRWCWDGVIPVGARVLLNAHPKCGKTQLLADLLRSGSSFCSRAVDVPPTVMTDAPRPW
jgi:AAA domain-containing protein